jgi:hypothetical protein
MPSKLKLTGFAVALTAFAVCATPGFAQSAPQDRSQALVHGTPQERILRLREPLYLTREERLAAKPLDWRVTTGKSVPRALTPEELRELQTARPTAADGGRPDPRAEAEARRLHPDDWK